MSKPAAALRAIAAVMLACSARAAHANPQPSAAAPAPGAGVTPVPVPRRDTPESAARRALVAATFHDGQITVGELEDAILEQNPFMQQRYVNAAAVRAVLERSLRFALLAAEAERRGYGERSGAVLAQNQASVQALIQQDFDHRITSESIPEADIRKYYDAHRDEFVRGEGRRASVLFLSDEAAATAALARARAADLRAFHELVRSTSVDATSKQRGGDVSYFDAEGRLFDDETGSVDAAIAKAAFGLHNVGDTSEVIQVAAQQARYAIVRLTGVRPAQDEPFAKAEERLRMRLWRERRQAAIDTHLLELRQSLNVRVHPELIDAVRLETGPALPPSTGLPSGFPHIQPGAPQDAAHIGAKPR